jgi:RimJ/RimL family protein N-acetyltransferase
MNNKQLIYKIKEIKGLTENTTDFAIPILNQDGNQIGSLKPIDIQVSLEKDTYIFLTKWRRMFKKYFLTQFKPTIERTKYWLDNIVMPSNDRLLFFILDENSKVLGNFGICNICKKSVELDNLIRGEKGGDKDLVFFSEQALLRWIYNDLDIPLAILHVFSNNYKTISLHERVGFSVTEEKKLRKVLTDDGVNFSHQKPFGEEVDFKYLTMELSRNNFRKLI